MNKTEVLKKAEQIVKDSKIALISLINDQNYPIIKAMLNLESNGLHKIYFSTNTSSKKVEQIKNNSNASIYYVNQNTFEGLLLVGNMKVTGSTLLKQRLWREGFEKYYSLGINDPDYCVLEFTTKELNYYNNLQNTTIILE